jgi:hypothetical protein
MRLRYLDRAWSPGELGDPIQNDNDLEEPKLCQRLRRYPPTFTDATDAEIQHFQRSPTPTSARTWLPKQH